MSSESNSTTPFTFWLDSDEHAYYYAQFWIFLVLSLLNIPCSIVVLHNYLSQADRRQALHNYVNLIILPINLFYQLTDIVFYLHYFRTFQLLSTDRTFRLIWGYIDWTFFGMQIILFAWATIERHILIFHDRSVATKVKRFLFHYFPPMFIVVYCLTFYTIVIFGSNCENIDPEDHSTSFYPCGFANYPVYLYETLVHQIAPNFIVVISSLILIIRVIRSKYRVHQQIRRRQHRRMTLQLLSISFLYLIFPTPYSCVVLLYLLGMPTWIGADFIKYNTFCIFYVLLLHPVVCAAALPNWRKKLCRKRRAIAPMTKK